MLYILAIQIPKSRESKLTRVILYKYNWLNYVLLCFPAGVILIDKRHCILNNSCAEVIINAYIYSHGVAIAIPNKIFFTRSGCQR